jgi:hypothetical protein
VLDFLLHPGRIETVEGQQCQKRIGFFDIALDFFA